MTESQYGIPNPSKQSHTIPDAFSLGAIFQKQVFPCTWNVRTLYKSGLLTAAVRELSRCKLDLVVVQEVRWDKGGTVRAGDNNFFLWERKRKSSIGNGIMNYDYDYYHMKILLGIC